jgi:linoleoyl-CoA desaturase
MNRGGRGGKNGLRPAGDGFAGRFDGRNDDFMDDDPARIPVHPARSPRRSGSSRDPRHPEVWQIWCLPVFDALPDATLKSDVGALRAAFRERGFYERPTASVLVVWLGNLVLGLGALAIFVAVDAWLIRIPAIVLSSMGMVALATIAHTASHNALSRQNGWNRAIFYLSYPFMLQMSARYWLYSHVQVHHPAPNIVGIDDDCDLRPSFAINDRHRAGVRGWRRRLLQLQWLTLPLLLPFNGFNIQRQAWLRLWRELRDPDLRSNDAWLDLACMVLHLGVFLILPMFFFPILAVIGVYLLRFSLIGIALFAVLAPGHFPAEAVCLDQQERDRGDFYLRQTVATVNFRTGPVGRWLCSGLQYQIEHHMFPSISHVFYPAMEPLVRQLCQRHGLPYRQLGWGEAIWKSYQVFLRPKRVLSDVEALRASDPAVLPTAAPQASVASTYP